MPYAITITRTEITGGDPWDPGSGTPTSVDHAGSGWVDAYDLDTIDGSLILSTDTRVMIVAASLDIEPTTADTLTISGVTYSIISVKRDPAGACWDVQCRA